MTAPQRAGCTPYTYLGDSVYVCNDGYHVWLETRNGLPSDPSNEVALEPGVLDALWAYVASLAPAGGTDAE